MRKYSLNQTKSTVSTAKAVANATPVTEAFVKCIMRHYTLDDKNHEAMPEEFARVQTLFNKWGTSSENTKLADLVEALTGFKPKTGVFNTIMIGKLFKNNNTIYTIAYVSGGYIYGINATANNYVTLPTTTNIGKGSAQFVQTAEAGEFAKAFLKVKGADLLTYIASAFSGAGMKQFMAAVEGTEIV